jgi:HEAT repeat protein
MISRKVKVAGLTSALLIAGLTFWYLRSQRGGPTPPAIDFEKFRAEQQEKDFATLSQDAPPATELFGAMIRMGQMQKPIARDKALSVAASQEAFLRSGAARTLANFEDAEAWQALQKLCKDSDPSVRNACLSSISARPSADRKTFVQKEFVAGAKNDSEKLEGLLALMSFEKSDSDRSTAIKSVLDIAKGKPQLEATLISRLINLSPRDAELSKLLQSTLENSDKYSLTVRTLAIRHLAAIREPKLLERYASLAASKEPEIKIALLQTFTTMCPPARWTLLDKFLSDESDAKVRSEALRVLSIMPTEDARVLLDRLIETGKFTESEERERAQATLKALSTDTRVDPCLGRNKITD